MGLYTGGLIIRRIFVSEIWGAYVQEGLFLFGGRGAYYRNCTVLMSMQSGKIMKLSFSSTESTVKSLLTTPPIDGHLICGYLNVVPRVFAYRPFDLVRRVWPV